jgi:hypothetical protein
VSWFLPRKLSGIEPSRTDVSKKTQQRAGDRSIYFRRTAGTMTMGHHMTGGVQDEVPRGPCDMAKAELLEV